MTYTGSAQALVTAGTATGGTMQYALGDADGATQPYTTSIPTATEAGTYYVWYTVKGDENHNDTEAQYVTAEIKAPEPPAIYTVTVTVNDVNAGIAAANPTSGTAGTAVTLSYTANEGWQFKEWIVISGGVNIADDRFVIGTANVEIQAVFEKPADPSAFVVDGGIYRVNLANGTAAYTGPVDPNTESVTVPDTIIYADGTVCEVTEIAANAFRNMRKLKTFKVGNNIRKIGNNAFYGCTKLSTLTLGKKLEDIGYSVFRKCTSLKKVIIPASVKRIGMNAFRDCKRLKTITIKTTKLTKKAVGRNCFKGIAAKATFKVPKQKLKKYTKWLMTPGGAPKGAKVTK